MLKFCALGGLLSAILTHVDEHTREGVDNGSDTKRKSYGLNGGSHAGTPAA
jgi:hypothetical protein